MNFYKIISRRPNCNHCGEPMESWNPFGDFHEHPECSADRVSDKLMEIIKQQFEAMKVKQIELTDQECSIIENALNAYWNEAYLQVQEGKVLMSNGDKRPIGDIEKKQQQWVVEHAKPLLEKFNNL